MISRHDCTRYNQMGSIDESSVDKLSTVCEFAKRIKAKADTAGGEACWAGLAKPPLWAGLGWAGLGWAGLAKPPLWDLRRSPGAREYGGKGR